MSRHLETSTILAQRLALRKLRSAVLPACLVLAIFQMEPSLFIALYALCALLLFAILMDLRRGKAALSRADATISDWLIMLMNALYLIGILLFTGRAASPLLGILLLPVIIYGFEFGFIHALFNALPMIVMVVWGIFGSERVIGAGRVDGPVLLLLTISLLIIINDSRRIHSHYHRKTSRMLLLDDLTLLYNRRFLKREVLRRLRAHIPFALVILDLNYFKFYNDRWGHPGGDALLVTLATVLREAAGPRDLVVRLSGDEFILLLEEADSGIVVQLLERLKGLLVERHFPGEECFPGSKLSISYGHVICRDETRSYDEILAAADAALYEHKKVCSG